MIFYLAHIARRDAPKHPTFQRQNSLHGVMEAPWQYVLLLSGLAIFLFTDSLYLRKTDLSSAIAVDPSQQDDSSCTCNALPKWDDVPFGRDAFTAGSLPRAKEVDLEIKRYTIQVPSSVMTVGEAYKLEVLARDSHSCDDSFFAQLRGPAIEEVELEADELAGSLPCVYSYVWQPRFEGTYELNVWLTYTNGSGAFEPSALQKHLENRRADIIKKNGRVKDLGIRGAKLSSMFPTHIRYGMPLRILPQAPVQFAAKKPNTSASPVSSDDMIFTLCAQQQSAPAQHQQQVTIA